MGGFYHVKHLTEVPESQQQCNEGSSQVHHKIHAAFLEHEVIWQMPDMAKYEEEVLVQNIKNMVKLKHN